ncbi:hypothetical protein LCGC14_0647920 [marine sediment metagenome]|uniref:HNH nuclease domain-containing protein n=1 Tax=marine sediment metagenome TaxID=412755 RepID=A0A0F9U5J8_9ZZZZ
MPTPNIKTIPRFPDYAITRDGRIWSKPRKDTLGHERKGRWLKLSNNSKGYWITDLSVNSLKCTCKVHRLVLETYIGPCPKGMECRHLNGNPSDNRLENLAWGTHQENQVDRRSHGTACLGEENGNSKLTNNQVKRIRYLYHKKSQGLREIARIFKVTHRTISLIIKKETWNFLVK